MRDLKDDVGFKLGPWNQAYQFDTLCDAHMSPDALQPGDLVFWKADYVDEAKKPFRFNMVHVEIFLGEGGQRMNGARWKTGKVSEFDSWTFRSTTWRDPELFFCSIEPWLRGECRPRKFHWSERSLDWVSHRRSILSTAADAPADQDDGDEPADAE